MGNERLGLTVSLALHTLLAGVIIAMARSVAPTPPILHLDCTLLELSSPSPSDDNSSKAQTIAPITAGTPAVSTPAPPVPETEPAQSITPRKLEPTKTKIRRQPVAPSPGHQKESAPETPASAPTPAATATGNAAPNPAPATGTSTGEIPAIPTDEAYRQANFIAIRESILGRLHYPLLARRRGWSGLVELAFTITPDGSIRDLRILTSSGFSLLDDEALSAIRQTAPFSPPPQFAAALTMPITFRLN
ncbi:MAG: energy transducer TonB [Pseudomonadota bacterium]